MTISSDGLPMNDAERHIELMLYDYFKHLTTLALVALGGVLSISQGEEQVSGRGLLLVVGFISISGGTALTGLDVLTKARLRELPFPKTIKYYRMVSSIALSLGIGAYLALFLAIFQ